MCASAFGPGPCASRVPALEPHSQKRPVVVEREFFIDNLLVRIQFIFEMIWWTGFAQWEFEFPFPGSLMSTFLGSSYRYWRCFDEDGAQMWRPPHRW